MASPKGLSSAEVAQRQQQGKTNRPPKSPTKTAGQIVRDNLCTYFNLVFVVLAVMLASVGSWLNMGFLGVVFCNTLIGIAQQLRAKKTIDELTLVSAHKVRCLRDDTWNLCLSEELVQDDVVEFGAGDQIVADAVVLAARDGKFLSRDDFRNRTKVSKSVIDRMSDLGIFGDLPESNQISLFDFQS